jgi:hypothetical protein
MLHNRRNYNMTSFALVTLHKIAPESRYDAEEGAAERREQTNINVFSIRAFYPRKGGKPGTRITFNDGGGFAVAELTDYVREAAIAVAKGKAQPAAPPLPVAAPVAPAAPAIALVSDNTSEGE